MSTVLVLNALTPGAMSVGCTGVGMGAGMGAGMVELEEEEGVLGGAKQLLPSAFFVVLLSGQQPYKEDAHDCGNGGGYWEQFEPVESTLHVVEFGHVP